MSSITVPAQGQLVEVRQRQFVVTDVQQGSLPKSTHIITTHIINRYNSAQHLVTLSSVEDDALGESLQVIWEIEPGARVFQRSELAEITAFDDPILLDAFLDAARWGAISSADHRNVQSPFRSGIEIEDYQLDPVVRAVQMHRVCLLIADDVGLGKTIESGLVIQEMILRNRVRKVLVVCPSDLQIQWQEQVRDKFGLEFRIIDGDAMKELRRKRGIHVNPWNHFPRLITSMDYLKRERPFRLFRELLLGLWVGGNTTPNKTSHSKDAVEKIRGNQAYQISNGTPHQLTNCPWWGQAIDPKRDIIVEGFPSGSARTIIYCGDQLGDCPFSNAQSEGEGLPVLVVDEEIYRRLPALLIATVDKFAQMPWNGAVQMLFGQVNGYCDRHGFRSPEIEDKERHYAAGKYPSAKTAPRTALRPPDLIIQDELHLISGPLGSLVGLYETAVDDLCSWEVNGQKVRPKVIASTATIRQARDQIYKLFLRNVQIFPPQCIDIEDNFFSRQRETGEEYPGRKYLGICAPGKRLKAALIRVYVAQLSASQTLYQKYGGIVDPWMTLVGYFNSIRELGGMRRMIDDDVAARLQKMDRRGLAVRRNLATRELTSRISSTDIPFILDQLEKTFDPTKEPKDIPPKERPIDVLLATNMISVGVDVPRLGAMIAAGQPKSTAEYIQATSRVGRSKPGLVITVYNWARPRDLSHFEAFENFHARFYRYLAGDKDHSRDLSLSERQQQKATRHSSAFYCGL